MILYTGQIVSYSPSEALSDVIQSTFGDPGLENWSFIETIPAGAMVDEWQLLTLSDWGTGDSFKLTYNSVETAALNYASDIGSALLAAVNAIAPFNEYASTLSVTRVDATHYYIKFSGPAVTGKTMPYQFTVTSAVGCSGEVTVYQAAIPATGAASYSCDVFKCSGSGIDANDAGIDWYVGFIRYSAFPATNWDSAVFFVAEEYDPTTKRFAGTAIKNSGKISAPFVSTDASGYAKYGTAYEDQGAVYRSVYQIFTGGTCAMLVLTGTGFNYFVHITNNELFISAPIGSSQHWTFMGLMDSLVDASLDDELPLFHFGDGAGFQENGVQIRIPGGVSLTGIAKTCGAYLYPWSFAYSATGLTMADGNTDLWKDQKINVSRVMVLHGTASGSNSVQGQVRGLLKSTVRCTLKGGDVSVGDKFTIDEEDWIVLAVAASDTVNLLVKE